MRTIVFGVQFLRNLCQVVHYDAKENKQYKKSFHPFNFIDSHCLLLLELAHNRHRSVPVQSNHWAYSTPVNDVHRMLSPTKLAHSRICLGD